MPKLTHSPVLFTEEDGTPMIFSMRIIGESDIKDMIEHGGGTLQGTDAPGIIRLVDPKSKVLNVGPSIKLISLQFIYDCVKSNYILPIDNYAVKLNSLDTSDISDEEVPHHNVDHRKDNFDPLRTKKDSVSKTLYRNNKCMKKKVSSSKLSKRKTSIVSKSPPIVIRVTNAESTHTKPEPAPLVKDSARPHNGPNFGNRLSSKIYSSRDNATKMCIDEDGKVLLACENETIPQKGSQFIKSVAKQNNQVEVKKVKLPEGQIRSVDKTLKISAESVHKSVALQDVNKQKLQDDRPSLRSGSLHLKRKVSSNFPSTLCSSSKVGNDKLLVFKNAPNALEQQQTKNNLNFNSHSVQRETEKRLASSSNLSHKTLQESAREKQSYKSETEKQHNDNVADKSLKPSVSSPLVEAAETSGNKVVRLYENYVQNSLELPESLEMVEPTQGPFVGNKPKLDVGSKNSAVIPPESERLQIASNESSSLVMTPNALADIDEFDKLLLHKLQQNERRKEADVQQEGLSQSYTVSSTADPISSQKSVPGSNESLEIFPDENDNLPDSATQEESVPDKRLTKETYGLLISEAVEIVSKLKNVASLTRSNERGLSPHSLTSSIRRINRLIYKPSLALETEKLLRKGDLSTQDKCTLVKYLCSIRNERPEDVLRRIRDGS